MAYPNAKHVPAKLRIPTIKDTIAMDQYLFPTGRSWTNSKLRQNLKSGHLPLPDHPDKPALLIELKYEKNADTALEQIRRQHYPDRLNHYKGKLLLVSINYRKDARNTDPDFKRHECRIEKA